MSHPAEQKYFLGKLKEKEIARQGTSVVSSLMETSFERNFFESSLNFVTVHREWVKSHPRPSDWNTRAQDAMTDFVTANPTFRNNTIVIELETSLKIVGGPEEGKNVL